MNKTEEIFVKFNGHQATDYISQVLEEVFGAQLQEGEGFPQIEFHSLPNDSLDFRNWLKRAIKRDCALMVEYRLHRTGQCLDEDSQVPFTDGFQDSGVTWKRQDKRLGKDSWLPIVNKGKQPVLFLDRDGIINEDSGYASKVEEIRFVEGITDLIKWAREQGRKIIVLTNQSGVGRGYYTEEDILILHDFMAEQLNKRGAPIDAWYFSPHHPEGNSLYKRMAHARKPGPGMALQACAEQDIDLNQSLMIGDKMTDRLNCLDIPTFFLIGNYKIDQDAPSFSTHGELLKHLKQNF